CLKRLCGSEEDPASDSLVGARHEVAPYAPRMMCPDAIPHPQASIGASGRSGGSIARAELHGDGLRAERSNRKLVTRRPGRPICRTKDSGPMKWYSVSLP